MTRFGRECVGGIRERRRQMRREVKWRSGRVRSSLKGEGEGMEVQWGRGDGEREDVCAGGRFDV